LHLVLSLTVVDFERGVVTLSVSLWLLIIARLKALARFIVLSVLVVALVTLSVARLCPVGLLLLLRVIVKSFTVVGWWLFVSSEALRVIFVR